MAFLPGPGWRPKSFEAKGFQAFSPKKFGLPKVPHLRFSDEMTVLPAQLLPRAMSLMLLPALGASTCHTSQLEIDDCGMLLGLLETPE
jgi:hypothetical protein